MRDDEANGGEVFALVREMMRLRRLGTLVLLAIAVGHAVMFASVRFGVAAEHRVAFRCAWCAVAVASFGGIAVVAELRAHARAIAARVGRITGRAHDTTDRDLG